MYDPVNREHYMFGGNPEKDGAGGKETRERFDDFWKLKLIRWVLVFPMGLRHSQLTRDVWIGGIVKHRKRYCGGQSF